MATTSYFTLTNSTASLSKRFVVIHQGYSPVTEKATNVRKTLDGKYDVSSGGIFKRHEYVIKVRDTVTDTNYGTKDDLETFFMLNNPNPAPGQPSNKLTLVDHYSASYRVMMVGDFGAQLMGVMMEGENAVYIVKAVFLILEDL